ncbi:MAG: phosphoenolpyruvate synthase, partial [Acidobacteria bacterium]
MMPWILDVRDAAGSADAGGKARALARAERAGLPVPSSFVLSASAFDDSLTAEQRASFEQTNDGRALARTVDAVAVAEPIRQALETAVRTLCPNGELVAVRSSASDEDGT